MDIYLAQKERPGGMGYFDLVMSEVHGLRVRELLDERAAGRKVIGSFCVFVLEEIVRAADATLVGLCTGADFRRGERDEGKIETGSSLAFQATGSGKGMAQGKTA